MKRLIGSLAAVVAAVGLVGSTGIPSAMAVASAGAHRTGVAKLSAPLLGVDVYSESDYSVSATTQYGSTVLPYVRDDLNSQVVSLMWDLCTPTSRSNSVRACKSDAQSGTGSMSPADISDLASIAKKDGLGIQMRPIIRVGPPSGWNNPHLSWEGHIKPANLEAWFKSVLKAELPYLKVARSVGVEQFVVGTEWLNVRYSKWWPWFLGKAHAACGCQVSYAAPTSLYLNNSANLPHVKALGTDFYPALNLPSSASQAKVTAAWEKTLASVPESRLDRTSLDEISIRATAGAYRHPSSWNLGGRADPTVQVRYFTAACDAAARYHVRALFFYFIPLNDDPAHPVNFPAYFVGNAGSKAIAGCRKILATGAAK
jgi:hypothetical protein